MWDYSVEYFEKLKQTGTIRRKLFAGIAK